MGQRPRHSPGTTRKRDAALAKLLPRFSGRAGNSRLAAAQRQERMAFGRTRPEARGLVLAEGTHEVRRQAPAAPRPLPGAPHGRPPLQGRSIRRRQRRRADLSVPECSRDGQIPLLGGTSEASSLRLGAFRRRPIRRRPVPPGQATIPRQRLHRPAAAELRRRSRTDACVGRQCVRGLPPGRRQERLPRRSLRCLRRGSADTWTAEGSSTVACAPSSGAMTLRRPTMTRTAASSSPLLPAADGEGRTTKTSARQVRKVDGSRPAAARRRKGSERNAGEARRGDGRAGGAE